MKITEKILILTNGDFPKREKALKLLDSNLSLICCDGAANRCYSAGYNPDIIIGDIDSLDSELKDLFSNKIIKYEDQNSNDLSKALSWANKNNIKSVTILGADGGGDDHYLGNLFLVLENNYNFKIKIITNSGDFDLINGGRLESHPNQKVSIFCTNREAQISSKGLKYELKNYKFTNFYGATLNESLSDSFTITCDTKNVNILVFRKDEEVR